MRIALAIAICITGMFGTAQAAEQVGAVDTTWKLVGSNNQIVIEVFDDPKVAGVSCYVSRAKAGGAAAMVGMGEDPSDASVACRQVGDIKFAGPLPKQEEVFSTSASVLFKKMHLVRAVDAKRNVLTYLVFFDKLIDGSPKNSLSVVPVQQSLKIPLK